MTRYEIVVACILFVSFFWAFMIALFGWLFPKDENDPFSDEFPGVSAPREE
jgi:hypothetical protein